MLAENDDGIQHICESGASIPITLRECLIFRLVALALLLDPPFINTRVKLLEFGDQRDS